MFIPNTAQQLLLKMGVSLETLFGHYVVRRVHPTKKGPGRKASGFFY